jgi:hypothetical protein
MDAVVAVALITGIAGLLGTGITSWMSYKTNQRIDELEDQVKELQRETCQHKKTITRLKKYLREWWEGIQSLLHQIGELGHEPVWQPEAPPDLDEDSE